MNHPVHASKPDVTIPDCGCIESQGPENRLQNIELSLLHLPAQQVSDSAAAALMTKFKEDLAACKEAGCTSVFLPVRQNIAAEFFQLVSASQLEQIAAFANRHGISNRIVTATQHAHQLGLELHAFWPNFDQPVPQIVSGAQAKALIELERTALIEKISQFAEADKSGATLKSVIVHFQLFHWNDVPSDSLCQQLREKFVLHTPNCPWARLPRLASDPVTSALNEGPYQ